MELAIENETFEHSKRGMNSVLNLKTTWTTRNFLNYRTHFSSTVADWYNSLYEESKNTLRIIETLVVMLKKLRKKIKTEFIGAKLHFEEKVRE